MNKKITFLTAALALLAFLAPATVGWGQSTYTKVTTAPADWSGTYVIVADDSNVAFTGQSGSNNYGGYAAVTISSGSVTGNYSDYEVLVEKSGDYYTMKHVSSGKYLGWNTGNNLHFSTDEPSTDAFKWNLSTSSILNANDNARKLQYNSGSPRFACYTSSQKVAYLYLKESVSPTTVATTTTIDASGITNTDVYTGTAAGSLTATVTETESGNAVSGATVTWTSSKENVATIDENGVVTLVAAGTTTITASYEGVSGEFGASSATYELTVTNSAPYEQPTEFEIGLNNTLFGTNYNGSVSGITDANPIVGTQDNVTVTYAGGGSHYVNDAQIRFYPNNKLTFEAPEGYEIKEIVFTADGQWNATISADGGTYDSDTKTWTGSATSVLFIGSGSSVHCRMSKATITLSAPSEDAAVTLQNYNINVLAEGGEGILTVQYQNIDEIEADIQFYKEDGETETTAEYYENWFTAEIDSDNNVSYLAVENTGTERKACFKVFALDNQAENVYSNLITITQAEYVAPAQPSNYVLTDFADLSPADVFVIVGKSGDNYYALPHNNGTSSAPAAIEVTLTGNYLAASTDFENLRWNISGNETVGYTFYPYLSNTTWLYCTNANNGVRVGTNNNKAFSIDNDGYLTNTATSRILSIYINGNTPQDWRCYENTNNNPVVVSFYRLVSDEIEYTKNIDGYSTVTNPDGGYYLIASPVASVTPAADNGFIATPASDYDLYSFDPNEANEWRNYKQGNGFDLVSGKGYLYASKYDTELIFKGEPYNGNGEVTLTKSENNTSEVNKAMNLVGNPYATKATPSKDYYTLNDDGSEIVADPKTAAIDPMVGIFVKADYDGETMTFTPQDGQSAPQQLSQIVANLRQDRRNATIDRAIVRFGDDSQLPKFMFNEDNTKLYIPQNGVDYAVVCNEGEAEMPINFKAAQNGTYTLSFEVENLEMDQLTLIDNLTGTETNLLACPSYTFDARTTDYASRFRLVFSYTSIGENSEIANFAYYNGSEWVINATDNATVEVIDMMGRVIRVCTDGVHTVSTNGMASGVYMMRLIDGNNVKTQKIVVE